MKNYSKEILKDAANRLMFDMEDNEYDTLLAEFKTIISQMELIGKNSSVDDLEPMIYPFDVSTTYLREDVPGTPLDKSDALKNAKSKEAGQVKLPKVL